MNEETNTVTVSFKGTNPSSGEDLAADVALFDNKAVKAAFNALGIEAVGQGELKEVRDLIQNVQSKYEGKKIVATDILWVEQKPFTLAGNMGSKRWHLTLGLWGLRTSLASNAQWCELSTI